MPVSRMTNLRPNDTWKMKIFNAPCREWSIKMKGQAVSSSFVSVQMNFLHFYTFFFWMGAGEAKYSEGIDSKYLKTSCFTTSALRCWASQRHWCFGRNLDLLSMAGTQRKVGSRWDQGRWWIPRVLPALTGCSLLLLPPPFPLEMFLLHVGEWWALWFHSEIICFQRRKRSLGQTQKIELRNLLGMS